MGDAADRDLIEVHAVGGTLPFARIVHKCVRGMLAPMQRDHRVGVRLDALLGAIADDARPDGPALAEVGMRIQDVLHLECRARLRELKRLWASYDPNPEGVPRPPTAGREGLTKCWQALDELLTRANYVKISTDELDRSLDRQSLFPLALHTRLDDFAQLQLWRRGLTTRTETVSTWFGLRRRAVRVESYERVVLAVRFQDADHFAGSKRRLPFTPGEATIKLFQDVPTDDLEMLFPNTTVKMRLRDHLTMWLPTLFGGIGVLTKSLGPLMVVGGLLWLRMSEGGGMRALEPSEWAALGLAGSAAVAIVLFSIRQLSRFKARKIEFLQLLTRNLYFRNLDNNAGVFHRVLDSAEEEETAEAALGYALLRWHGPTDIAGLDGSVEAWLAERFGVKVDLEADDALAKLERLGLAVQEDGRWRALAPAEALAILDRRWAQPQPRSSQSDSRGSQMPTSVRATSNPG
jgi:hypothetical protein